MLFNKWYLDDGVLAGTSLSVRAALDVISSLGPSLGLYINFAKCEVFGKAELSAFPSEITKRYHTPQLEILGAPIGNEEFCNNFVINKQSSVSFLLQQLQGLENPQLALALLRKCAAFCKMTHISRVTPPTLIKSSLSEFDDSIHHCFTECLALNLSPQSSGWKQACLSLSRGGLGLRSVAVHSTAAYLGSVSSSSPDLASSHYVIDALNLFNLQVSAEDTVSIPLPMKSHFQHDLSQRIENCQFHALYNSGSLADRARLLSISSAHASSWLQVVPSPRQGCDMATSEMQWGIKWWLGLPLTPELGVCAYCPDKALDAHHAVTCKFGGDVVACHNALRNAIFDFCKRALLNPKLEAGAGLGHERRLTRPADILIPSWSNGDKPAAIDVSITSPLKSNIFLVLHKLVSAIATDEDTAKLLFHAWYLDDGVVAGPKQSASQLLSQIEEVGSVDPQVALLLLRMCGAFCKMVHLARSTPPSLVAEGFRYFDNDIRHCFASCTGVDTSDDAWEQAQLSLSRGGFGLRRLSKHSPACYIASVCMSGLFSAPQQHLLQSIDDFNHCIPPSKAISFESLTNTPSSQKALSGELEDELFRQILSKSSVPDRARLLSVSSPHASAWLSVVPSPGLNLHLEPAEFQAAIQWWLGIGVAHGSLCPHCPHALDPLGHHALTCKHGGDVVNRHNRLRDVFAESCRRACIGVQVEAGSGLG
ncbi:hypothetical protein EMCRGX_G020790 [Ephydatia muelleri]